VWQVWPSLWIPQRQKHKDAKGRKNSTTSTPPAQWTCIQLSPAHDKFDVAQALEPKKFFFRLGAPRLRGSKGVNTPSHYTSHG